VETEKPYVFSGKVLVQGGAAPARGGQVDQELGTVEQARGSRTAGKVGAGAGTKKHKTPEAGVAPSFKISASDEGAVTREMSNRLQNNGIAVSVVSCGIGNFDNLLDVQRRCAVNANMQAVSK
jgi:hypothetical protein